MSRPKPTILLDYTDKKTFKSEQVLKADAVYAVFYDGQPINLRSKHSMLDYPSPKYKKASFQNKGHALNLVDKLNDMFKTDKFTVHKLTKGEKITKDTTAKKKK
jgi:hypothetical protein